MLTPNIKAAIFDIDGTLLDSLEAWADTDRIFLEENGIAYAPEISAKLKSLHYLSAAELLIKECGLKMTLEQAAARIEEIITYQYFHEVLPKEGAAEYLQLCRDKGLRLCAATSNLRRLAEGALSSCGLDKYFEFILTSDEVGSGKDDPDIFFKCAERLGAAPCDTAVFEDSLHAAEAAARAGFFTVGVYDEHYAKDFHSLASITDMTVKSFANECRLAEKGC